MTYKKKYEEKFEFYLNYAVKINGRDELERSWKNKIKIIKKTKSSQKEENIFEAFRAEIGKEMLTEILHFYLFLLA